MSATPFRENSIKKDTSEDNIQPAIDLHSEIGELNGPSILRARQVEAFRDGKGGLPVEKGFPIQVGSELFRLSGASIMSDAPSYFSKFFEDQLRNNNNGDGGVKTLYIDRDPATFQDIAGHLQGYRVQPRNGQHYVRLFADAQFYSLPRLIKQLFESEILITIGDEDFRIPREIFSAPGDSPNFFSLGFAALFNSPEEVFPGLDREGLLRPPSIEAPTVPGRSASIFRDILHLLRGYPLHIKGADHRAELLRDCRYYHLRGLEQKLIYHNISYNLQKQRSEIVLRLEDLRQSGISFAGDATPVDRSPLAGWVNYSRPFVDETSYELIVEIAEESTMIDLRSMRANFFGHVKARITSLFQVVANKMNLPTNVPLGLMMSSGGISAQPVSPGNTPLSEDRVKVSIERDAHIILDGETVQNDNVLGWSEERDEGEHNNENTGGNSSGQSSSWRSPDQAALGLPSRSPSVKPPPRKRKRRGSLDDFGEWVVLRGQWRLRVQPRQEQGKSGQRMEIVMCAVKLDAVSGQRGRNMQREFLST